MSALAGKRVVVTRATHQADELSDLLREYGAVPLSYPCIAIVAPADVEQFDIALHDAIDRRFDRIALTSVNTVYAISERLKALGLQADALSGVWTACVGVSTAFAAAQILHVDASIVPDEYSGEALAEKMRLIIAPAERVLLPQSDIAEPILRDGLITHGANVTAIPAYRTVIGEGGIDIAGMLREGSIHAITFASSSAARNFWVRLAADGGDVAHLDGVCLACIGSVTAETLQETGYRANVIPAKYTLDAMVSAMEMYYSHGREGAHDA